MPALDGMRILDLTQYEAGPSCTQALAWLGADVVKVEAPGSGDPGRWIAGGDDYFWNWNLNKRSVVLNLRNPEGRQLLLDLLPKFDVVMENYAPGVTERLGLDYETFKSVNPSIIFASVKGYGSDGPYANYLAYDMCAQAAAGTFSMTGQTDPRRFPVSRSAIQGPACSWGWPSLPLMFRSCERVKVSGSRSRCRRRSPITCERLSRTRVIGGITRFPGMVRKWVRHPQGSMPANHTAPTTLFSC